MLSCPNCNKELDNQVLVKAEADKNNIKMAVCVCDCSEVLYVFKLDSLPWNVEPLRVTMFVKFPGEVCQRILDDHTEKLTQLYKEAEEINLLEHKSEARGIIH